MIDFDKTTYLRVSPPAMNRNTLEPAMKEYPADFMAQWKGCSDVDCLPECLGHTLDSGYCARRDIAYAEYLDATIINAEDMIRILPIPRGEYGFACPLIGLYPCEKTRRGCSCHENYLESLYAPTHDGRDDIAVLHEVIAIIEAHFLNTFGRERVAALRRFAVGPESSTPLSKQASGVDIIDKKSVQIGPVTVTTTFGRIRSEKA